MSLRPRSRSLALLLSLVPGWGHVYWGREFLGLTIFTGAAVLGFAFLNARFVYQGPGRETMAWVAGMLVVLCEVVVWGELFLRTQPDRQRRQEEERTRLMEEGTVAYLQKDYQTALSVFRQCLRVEPQDVDAMFRLGVTHARLGDERQARGWLRKTLRYDLEEKWSWEVGRELERLVQGEHRRSASEGKKEEGAEQAS